MHFLAAGPLIKNINSDLDAAAIHWLQSIAPVFDMEFQDSSQALNDDISNLGKSLHSIEVTDKQAAPMAASLRGHIYTVSHYRDNLPNQRYQSSQTYPAIHFQQFTSSNSFHYWAWWHCSQQPSLNNSLTWPTRSYLVTTSHHGSSWVFNFTLTCTSASLTTHVNNIQRLLVGLSWFINMEKKSWVINIDQGPSLPNTEQQVWQRYRWLSFVPWHRN